MIDDEKVKATLLATGVPGLDLVLGGGLPELSFNLIAGEPGGGKTTLVHQIMFANVSPERRGLYFTVLGEPPIKMVRHLQQFAFFDPDKVLSAIEFVDLSTVLLQEGLSGVLQAIMTKVRATQPAIVAVDSFRTALVPEIAGQSGNVSSFLQQLAIFLVSWEATTFLIAEYAEGEMSSHPVFTISDSIVWLSQAAQLNASIRKLRVVKMRGQAQLRGLHTFRICDEGVEIFPRARKLQPHSPRRPRRDHRLSIGHPGIDGMMGGGLVEGDSLLLSGASGTGKSMLACQFVGAGYAAREACVVAVFEEHPQDYLSRAKSVGVDLEAMQAEGLLEAIYLSPLDLSVDEALHDIERAVTRIGAKRVVIDSLTGFEIALAPEHKEDFRESVARLVAGLTASGVTVLMTMELVDLDSMAFSPKQVSFLTDDIITLRYVEVASELRLMIAIGKMRRSAHSRELREFTITSRGLKLEGPLRGYQGLLTGTPRFERYESMLGVTALEGIVARELLARGPSTVEQLATATGLESDLVQRALTRLNKLGRAVRVRRGQTVRYRPVR